jgi:hypothetical protein
MTSHASSALRDLISACSAPAADEAASARTQLGRVSAAVTATKARWSAARRETRYVCAPSAQAYAVVVTRGNCRDEDTAGGANAGAVITYIYRVATRLWPPIESATLMRGVSGASLGHLLLGSMTGG